VAPTRVDASALPTHSAALRRLKRFVEDRGRYFHKRLSSVVAFDNNLRVGYLYTMAVRLLLNERRVLTENAFVEVVVWLLDKPTSKSCHNYKYRLALILNNQCVLRYDNEAGKGDHRHFGDNETPYVFVSPQTLLEDFWNDVKKWRY
jgi:hypothetical protein